MIGPKTVRERVAHDWIAETASMPRARQVQECRTSARGVINRLRHVVKLLRYENTSHSIDDLRTRYCGSGVVDVGIVSVVAFHLFM
jgi:hypothetical protein